MAVAGLPADASEDDNVSEMLQHLRAAAETDAFAAESLRQVEQLDPASLSRFADLLADEELMLKSPPPTISSSTLGWAKIKRS